jgi:hypothetical protein
MTQLKDLTENDFIKVKNIEELKLLKANARHRNERLYNRIKYLKNFTHPVYISYGLIVNENNIKTIENKDFNILDLSDLLDIKEMEFFIADPFRDIKKSKTEVDNSHYDNSNGSLYLFAEQQKLNAWEFEVIKRTVRCRKKGEFISDIEKTIKVLEIYLKEQGEKYEGQIEKINK